MRRFANQDGHFSSGRAFTLVELLVTVGVVLILAGLLMSAVSSARKKSADVRCMANLRVLGQGIQQYAADNQMKLPPGAVGSSQWFKAGIGSWVLDYVMEGTRKDFPSYYRCPLDKTESPYRFYYSYTWNSEALKPYDDLTTPSKDGPIFLWQVTQTILMADGLSKSEDPSVATYPTTIVALNAVSRLSHRHRDGVNALLGDGSVRWMVTEEAALPENIIPKK